MNGLDRPAMNALPADAYEYAEWKKASVNIDYHIEVGRHYCSVLRCAERFIPRSVHSL